MTATLKKLARWALYGMLLLFGILLLSSALQLGAILVGVALF